jgi:phosphoribosylformimino-5-aminoimidazole carboxamide ribotide isomerase
MIVLPAIDIQNGHAVRLRQGIQDDSTQYFDDPVEAAKQWEAQGAQYLHVVDLDGAFSGSRRNSAIISDICRTVHIPVEVGGGIRSREAIQAYLNSGVQRVVIGSMAVEDEGFITAMAMQFGNKLAVSVDAKGDMVATRGWVGDSDKSVIPFVQFLLSIGITTIVYTDISRDGMLSGPNMDMMAQLQALPQIQLIASGGVSGIDDLRALQQLGVYGAITGKALYEGKVTMEEINTL